MGKKTTLFAILFILFSFSCSVIAGAEEKVYKMGDYVVWWHSTNKPDWGGQADYPHDITLTEANIKNGNIIPITVTCTEPGTATVSSTEWESHGINSYPHKLSITINMAPLGHYAEQYPDSTEATCQSNATQIGYCIRCQSPVVKEIPNTQKKHSYTNYDIHINATCSSPATLIAYCDYKCGTSDQIKDPSGAIDPNNHSWGVYENNGNDTHSQVCVYDETHKNTSFPCSGGKATCIKQAVCDICQTPYGNVDANNHNKVILPAVAPTYTQTGLTEGMRCDDCKSILIPQEIIPMLVMVPQTGDESNVFLWSSLVFICLSGMIVLIRKKKCA